MDFKHTVQRAVLVTGIIAMVAAAILTTPAVITQLAVFVTAIFASSVLLLALSYSRWFQSVSPAQQARRIWLASSISSFIAWAVYWIPMIVKR